MSCNEKVAVSVFDGVEEKKGTAVCIGMPSYIGIMKKKTYRQILIIRI